MIRATRAQISSASGRSVSNSAPGVGACRSVSGTIVELTMLFHRRTISLLLLWVVIVSAILLTTSAAATVL